MATKTTRSQMTMAEIMKDIDLESPNVRRAGLQYWDHVNSLRQGSRTSRHVSGTAYVRSRETRASRAAAKEYQ